MSSVIEITEFEKPICTECNGKGYEDPWHPEGFPEACFVCDETGIRFDVLLGARIQSGEVEPPADVRAWVSYDMESERRSA